MLQKRRIDNETLGRLLFEAQFLDKGAVRALVVCLKVFQMLATICDKAQKAATRVLVFVIFVQMSRKLFNATCQNSNLYLRGAGVGLVSLRLYDLIVFLPLGKHMHYDSTPRLILQGNARNQPKMALQCVILSLGKLLWQPLPCRLSPI